MGFATRFAPKGASSLNIVPMPLLRSRPAPTGLLSTTPNDSVGSYCSSGLTSTVTRADGHPAEEAIALIGRPPNVRAEELAPHEFLALAEALK